MATVTKAKRKKIQPQKVRSVFCPKCKELLAKVYPYAVFNMNIQVACGKCANKVK